MQHARYYFVCNFRQFNLLEHNDDDDDDDDDDNELFLLHG